jgi:protein-arginine kinase
MNKLPETLYQNTAWDQEKNPIWIGSTLHLYRNFSIYKFPDKMTPAEMNGSLKAVFETLQKLPSLQPLLLFSAETLTPLEKELLFEYFQCSKRISRSAGRTWLCL